MMGARPTIDDIAREAGVSVATVDRVLNGRMRVREETARRVYEAALAIGYHASALIRQRMQADLPAMTFGFLLQKERQPFYQAVRRELLKAVEANNSVRGTAIIEFVEHQTPAEYIAGLERLSSRADAIALTSLDHHSVTSAVAEVQSRGKPVFSLLSDFAQGVRESYVGLNNVKVGRTAAWLISKTAPRPGKVALFVGGYRWHGHELRETGFRSFFRELAPEFQVLETLVNLETRQVTYEATFGLFKRTKDLVGLYLAGGGMEGAFIALRELAPKEMPAVVVNELTPDSLASLQDHLIAAVIGTPLTRMCASLVDMMISARLYGRSERPGQLFLPFDLHVPESI
jgi:LacI family transcriptional regulator